MQQKVELVFSLLELAVWFISAGKTKCELKGATVKQEKRIILYDIIYRIYSI